MAPLSRRLSSSPTGVAVAAALLSTPSVSSAATGVGVTPSSVTPSASGKAVAGWAVGTKIGPLFSCAAAVAVGSTTVDDCSSAAGGRVLSVTTVAVAPSTLAGAVAAASLVAVTLMVVTMAGRRGCVVSQRSTSIPATVTSRMTLMMIGAIQGRRLRLRWRCRLRCCMTFPSDFLAIRKFGCSPAGYNRIFGCVLSAVVVRCARQ